ncbi:RNA polymerase sigma factor [Lewinella sp. LCG006]|uniref:RNA polymerase sigma factor n=1 Tax=Lewinella sp. LCG006 TaxID=3231911 RepID=UPI0034600D8D
MKAYRLLLKPHESHLEDALHSAVQDGILIFLDKLSSMTDTIEYPEAFAFEIIKRNYWDKRRKAMRCLNENLLCLITFRDRQRYLNAEVLFDSLPEPQLLHWFHQLSPRDQRILNLRCQGYQDDEVAAQLGLSYGGVRNIFSRLLTQARELVKRA